MYTKNFEVVDSFHRISLNVWLIWKSIYFWFGAKFKKVYSVLAMLRLSLFVASQF